jgi:hypothetical protein
MLIVSENHLYFLLKKISLGSPFGKYFSSTLNLPIHCEGNMDGDGKICGEHVRDVWIF